MKTEMKKVGIRWLDKKLVDSVSGTQQICVIDPSLPTGQKEQRILFSSVNTGNIAEGTNQYFTNARALSAVEKTNHSVGWSLSGGETSKKLTLSADCSIDQNLHSRAAPTFAGGTFTGKVAIGLSAQQTPNALLHSAGSTIVGLTSTALPDDALYNNQIHPWLDESKGILNFKTKNSAGVMVNFPVPLERSTKYKTVVATKDYRMDGTEDLILVDSSEGKVDVYLQQSVMTKPVTIMKWRGLDVHVQMSAGTFLNGSFFARSLSGNFDYLTAAPTYVGGNLVAIGSRPSF